MLYYKLIAIIYCPLSGTLTRVPADFFPPSALPPLHHPNSSPPTSTMVLDPQHSQIAKRRKHRKLSIIPGLVIQGTASLILPFLFGRNPPIPMHTSLLSGAAYVQELLDAENKLRIQRVLGMKLEVFEFLCLELKSKGGLADSKFVSVKEQVAMFLFTLVHSSSNREVQERQ